MQQGDKRVNEDRCVSATLLRLYNITSTPGKKTTCPFCGHRTFSIKRDDTIGKCFHPSCEKCILAGDQESDHNQLLQGILQDFRHDCHRELIQQANSKPPGAYHYVTEKRGVHPTVVTDSMLGAVPHAYDLEGPFKAAFSEIESRIANADSGDESIEKDKAELAKLHEAKDKLSKCLAGADGWLCFLYTDHRHRVTSIRFRKPHEKDFRYFKPLGARGLFGHGLFSINQSGPGELPDVHMLVVEGEFNQLQLQSLALRKAEATGETVAGGSKSRGHGGEKRACGLLCSGGCSECRPAMPGPGV